MSKKPQKRKSDIAHDLASMKYRQRIVPNKKRYTRKGKNANSKT